MVSTNKQTITGLKRLMIIIIHIIIITGQKNYSFSNKQTNQMNIAKKGIARNESRLFFGFRKKEKEKKFFLENGKILSNHVFVKQF